MTRTLDQMLAAEDGSIVESARAKAHAIVMGIHLAELRSLVNKTQADLAQALGVKQPSIAGMEKAGQNLKLITLKRYVEAAGCKARLEIELPDGRHHGFPL
ncbi:helix-turn-helix transcriptional regulator [Allohahella marinimesophila]|uniref:XRE family transcriptional regulator n=1 Tax=Allohahella marinimesophila TaxID=1054972 RepID=A0ABP7PWP2_9GAMM